MTQLPPNGDEESSVAAHALRDVIIAAVPSPAASHMERWASVVRRVRRRRQRRLAAGAALGLLGVVVAITLAGPVVRQNRDITVKVVAPGDSHSTEPTSSLRPTSTLSVTNRPVSDRGSTERGGVSAENATSSTVVAVAGAASPGVPRSSDPAVSTEPPGDSAERQPSNTAEPPPSDVDAPVTNAPPRVTDPVNSVATTSAPAPWILPAGSSGSSTAQLMTGADANRAEPGIFKTFCAYAYMSNVDPLGGTDTTYHAFWGNTATASGIGSQPSATANSTCRGGILDRSAYWFVAMADTSTHTLVAPLQAQVFYSVGYIGVDPSSIEQMPIGLRLTVGPEDTYYGPGVQWSCGGSLPWTAARPTCANTTVYLRAFFPQCWDGRLDSPDHRSHLAYAAGGRCPSSHPRALPELSYRLVFQAPPTGIDSWQLLTGDSRSPIGGFVNGWDAQTQADWMAFCITTQRECVGHLGGGRMLDGEV